MTRILVVKEKHGDRYYDIDSDENWARACLEILENRVEQGYFNDEEPYLDPETQEAMNLTEEQLNAYDVLPAKYKENVIAARKRGLNILNRVKDQNANNAEIRRIVNEKILTVVKRGKGRFERSEPLAWRFLQERNDYEYEEVSIEHAREAGKVGEA